MFDTQSDYALNKVDKCAIVCPSVTGDHIRLTLEDFDSQEDFDFWKNWSDGNYQEIELAGRRDDDCLSFEAQRDAPVPSAEEVVLAPYIAAEKADQKKRILEQVRHILTTKQYRRLWKYHVDGLSVEKIAAAEKVSPRAIYKCIEKAEAIIVNIL